ncbi:uncharacterized protein BO87DRAFT_124256 [Aspergillus neoniger CBS 115656]|uniref:Uncharacterized protein n=1 Tax=Aspergillus neoniger (strain CBS 115656) TaxID=1448310 RepID=A0A318YAH2_ASPNB|nr:hypothetical protein BO87DRAFT_124256 [Aspergillus neoniger CBS 115656]PYH31345.1 hypothetical protein BO87DRAFT_124256 [Aspergillus neoniger CBS 115656]
MVAFKRFFHAEKSPPANLDGQEARAGSVGGDDHGLPNMKTSRRMAAGVHDQTPAEQFEVTHNQLQSRPLSSRSHAPPSRASTRPPGKVTRHVDLLDALFSSHRYHIQSSSTLSPITPYNEDIAERNMAPFLRGLALKNAYSHPVSSLYQEDVADRNISSRGSSRSIPRSTSSRSQATPPRSRQGSQRYVDNTRDRPQSRGKSTRLARSTSPESSVSVPQLRTEERPGSSREDAFQISSLRSQRSAPDLLAERNNAPREESVSSSNGYLGIPPAHKQGDKWSNTPLPDSPTLPLSIGSDSTSETESFQDTQSTPPASPRQGSKKNIRDLSINTKLAARGSPTAKIAHRAIQPPTPSAVDPKQAPSIAEVMNSPLPVGTPTSIASMPASNDKVIEIMDMFRQAFASTQEVTPHPTFESLQDAIVREINSHEAFQRISFPTEPSLTPSPSQESFDRTPHVPLCPAPGLERSLSSKEGQFSKLILKSSFKKHKRTPEQRRSISTSVPVTTLRATQTTSRRRHTDAPLPSPGVLGNRETKQQKMVSPREEMTYMDLLQSFRQPPSNPGRAVSMRTNSSHGNLTNMSGAPSVLRMRAQASPVRISQISYSEDDSNDEEIIQLPSVGGTPHVCIQGVDQNNVTYMARNTTPRNAYRLMNWPRKSSPNAYSKNALSSERIPSRTSSRNGQQF